MQASTEANQEICEKINLIVIPLHGVSNPYAKPIKGERVHGFCADSSLPSHSS